MPTQREDRDTQWSLDMGDSRYVLAADATITVDEGYGIYESTNNNEIVVMGDIVATGAAVAGIRFMSSTSTLSIGAKSHIDASDIDYGIFVEGAGQQIVNRGRIEAEDTAIHGEIWGKVENYGDLQAFNGIYFAGEGAEIFNAGMIDAAFGIVVADGGATITNDRGDSIEGNFAGISLGGTASSTIVNRGLIQGDTYAILCGDGAVNIDNEGKIVGDVELSERADLFDTTGGTVRGVIRGGHGDDHYYISSPKVRIDDQGASYFDTVFSTASYELTGGLDHLQLKGRADINATGNLGQNILVGNRGDNRLSGLEGDDHLWGYRGRDVLIGGAGEDVFTFRTSDGNDTIEDFQDGVDVLRSYSVNSQDDFDALSIEAVRGDLVIDFGDGTKVTLVDTAKAEITYSDFFVI